MRAPQENGACRSKDRRPSREEQLWKLLPVNEKPCECSVTRNRACLRRSLLTIPYSEKLVIDRESKTKADEELRESLILRKVELDISIGH